MKKIILSFFLATAIFASGCLKDKDYNDQKYGIQNTEVKGIGFVKRDVSVGVTSEAVAQPLGPVTITAHSIQPPDANINYTLVSSPSLVALDTTLTVLPASAFTFAATGAIEKGKYSQTVVVTITNPSLLNPLLKYGIALTIATSDAGYQIAENSKTVLISISIKNKYDGVYKMNSFHNRPGYQTLLVGEEMHMITTGPSEVAFYWPEVDGLGHPMATATGGVSWYGATVAPSVVFNVATNSVTNVFNSSPAGPPISVYAGAGSGAGRYDPVTKKMYVYFRYNANDARAFTDTLTYVGPR